MIFKRFTDPCVVIRVMADEWVGKIIKVSDGVLVINVGADVMILNCDRALHAWIPSYHVCGCFVLPPPPQFLNQEPPRPQQLILSDFPMVPHLGHTTEKAIVVVVSAGVLHRSRDSKEKYYY